MSSERRRPRSRTLTAVVLLSLLGCLGDAGRTTSHNAADAPLFSGGAGASEPTILVGAGNIARCDGTGDEATAALLDAIAGTVFTLGDNAFPSGAATDFANCYDASWGRHRARTMPAVGDVDYLTTGAAAYYSYFGAAAGMAGKGYYSYDAGSWRVIVLNSAVDKSVGSPQEQWLRAELAANPRACILAYWHHPLYWSGSSSNVRDAIRPLWDALYAAGADVVVNAHNRNYERFARQRPDGSADPQNGIRQFIVGTGGYDLSSAFGTPLATSEVRSRVAFGVLRLALGANEYSWEFVPIAGSTFRDSGTDNCSPAATQANRAPSAHAGGAYTVGEGVALVFDGTGSSDPDGDAITFAWSFGDGTSGTGVRPAHVYADNGAYPVTVTVTDVHGASAAAATTVTVTNSAPLVNAGADAAIDAGATLQLAASFTDAGSQDAPWRATVNWGDGTTATTLTMSAQGGVAATHTYGAAGSYAVRVQVTDKDGATGSDELTVTVSQTPPAENGAHPVLVGAGNIARCDRTGDSATASLLDNIAGTVMALGDNAYPNGTVAEYANCYHPTWGRHRDRTFPAVGNHDYDTGSAQPYFSYFGARAGDPTRGYYSYDLGTWHIIVLNSNKDYVPTANNSAQIQWLRADLAAAASRGVRCTLAYWHHPRFYHGGTPSHRNTSVLPFWTELYAANVDVVVNAHFHMYERYALQRPDGTPDAQRGIRQFIVGTGGYGHDAMLAASPNVEVRNTGTWGVLKLTLEPDAYAWEFVPETGKTFTDTGRESCR